MEGPQGAKVRGRGMDRRPSRARQAASGPVHGRREVGRESGSRHAVGGGSAGVAGFPGALAGGWRRGRRPEAEGAGPLGGAWVPAPAGRAGSRVGAAGADWLAGARAGRAAAAARRGRSPRSLASASAARRRAPPALPPPPGPPTHPSAAGGHHEHRPAVQEQAGDPR